MRKDDSIASIDDIDACLTGENIMKDREVKNRRRRHRMKKRDFKRYLLLATLAAVFMVAVLIGDCRNVSQQNQKRIAQEAELQELIQEEDERTEEIENLAKRVEEQEYIEYVGRNNLGLAYDDEIIFRSR